MPPAVHTVIFDASCGFCQQQVRWLRALDWRRTLCFVTAMNGWQQGWLRRQQAMISAEWEG